MRLPHAAMMIALHTTKKISGKNRTLNGKYAIHYRILVEAYSEAGDCYCDQWFNFRWKWSRKAKKNEPR